MYNAEEDSTEVENVSPGAHNSGYGLMYTTGVMMFLYPTHQYHACDSHVNWFILQVSIVEVYNECVYDLLVPPSEGHEKLQVQKRGKEVVVPVSVTRCFLVCSVLF